MTGQPTKPSIQPSGLVTVAFLKAQLDEGSDQLGIFMPLVLDSIQQIAAQSFTTADVQDVLARRHAIAMPQQAVATLLGRATRKKYLQREMGRYHRNPAHPLPRSNVLAEKQSIEAAQTRLAETLLRHAAHRGLTLPSAQAALELLYQFLQQEQVALLRGAPMPAATGRNATSKERAVVAEFIDAVIRDDPAMRAVLRSILDGLVLYHAAFLPDISTQSRRFNGLKVAFDSVLVRQTLGYEGLAMRSLLGETVTILRAADAACIVFDKTLHEIHRILSMYEAKLATDRGRRSLRPVPMARHFLTQHYAPSDVREMSALLEHDVLAAGFQIIPTPPRIPEHTAAEQLLARRLADPRTGDELEPRVQHDVDCVAAILTLRHGHTSVAIEHAGAVFATSAPLVIRHTRDWYVEDEHATGVEPIVHIRALVNLAWLKKPQLAANLKEQEIVALCAAALRPRQETWDRFLRHLDSLEQSQRLTSDEVSAIVASAMSDNLLREAEEDDPNDIDAVTLDDIVDRVKQSYSAEAEERIRAIKTQYESQLKERAAGEATATAHAEEAKRAKEEMHELVGQYDSRIADLTAREGVASADAERARRTELGVQQRARALASAISTTLYVLVTVIVLGGAGSLIVGHPFHTGWVGILLGAAAVAFVALECFGILRHVREWRSSVEARLTMRFRRWLTGNSATSHTNHTTQPPSRG